MASFNKASKLRNNIAERMDLFDTGNGNANSDFNEPPYDELDDEYCLEHHIEPPRFAYYKQVRKDNPVVKEWEYDARETMDERNFYLKQRLRELPEQRYQDKRPHYYWHDSPPCTSTPSRKNNEEECWCSPECRFYPKYGRIEDEEVIAENNKYIEHLRQKNWIMEIPLPDNWRELIRR
jgi:hypothetical protein